MAVDQTTLPPPLPEEVAERDAARAFDALRRQTAGQAVTVTKGMGDPDARA